MRAPVNDALTIDDQRLRRRLGLATWQQLLTEQNVFRALTFILFCSVVTTLLFYCDFLPFGTDNNETFSSILHAKNMYLHGVGSTYGLTSETTSPTDTAQFVYTHQGNFPRFYALLLYLIGARSAEAQILITTLTVGLASILFAYVYMERRVNALFAFIFCGVLITDYIMGLQWFVNTWRVWHFFFFFSTLLLAHSLADSAANPRKTALNCSLLLINFACLFYFEIIFAAFVTIFFALYLAFLLRQQPKTLLLGLAVSGIGSVLAISALLMQIMLYLGWQGLLSDLSYTFFSRNAAPANLAAFQERALEFMREHNIVFWDNFTSENSQLRTPGEMLRLFFRFNLVTQTPMLVLLSLLLTAAAWLHAVTDALSKVRNVHVTAWMHGRAQPDTSAALLVPAFVLFGLVVALSGTSYGITDNRHDVFVGSDVRFISVSLIVVSAVVLLVAVFRSSLVKNAVSLGSAYRRLGAARVPATVLLAVIAVNGVLQARDLGLFHPLPVLLSAITGGAAVLWIASSRCMVTNARLVVATAFLIGFAAFAHYHAWLYQPIHYDVAPNHFEAFWSDLIARRGGPTFWKIAILATALLTTLITLGVMDDTKSPQSIAILSRIAPYWLIGIVAYVIVFLIAPGYLYTGYQVHNAPFAIYLTALSSACAVYVLCSLARNLPGQFVRAYRTVETHAALVVAARAVLLCGLLATIVGTWLAVQVTYLRRIPPDRVAPLFHALKKIAGASTVVSTYATPVAIGTGQWSYFDPTFFHGGDSFDGNGYKISAQDFRYLWFGDWKSNVSYRTPAYFVCWLHLNFFDVVSEANRWSCGRTLKGVRDVREGRSIFDHREVFRDHKRDLWSIVKLDWEYPPYLRSLDEFSPDIKVRATSVVRPDGFGFVPEIEPRQQEGRPILGAHYTLYAETGANPTCGVSSRRVVQFADNPADLLLPKEFKGCVQIGVAPFTATKTGSEYYSDRIIIGTHQQSHGGEEVKQTVPTITTKRK